MSGGESNVHPSEHAVPEHKGTQEFHGVHSNMWSKFMTQIYKDRQMPLLKTVSVKEVEELAREKMKDRMGKYIDLFTSTRSLILWLC